MDKLGQISMEFMVLMATIFIIFTAFLIFNVQKMASVTYHNEEQVARDYGKSLQKEFLIASSVSDGYSRQFNVRSEVSGVKLNISSNDKLLFVRTGIHDLYYKIPNVSGSIRVGKNLISKNNGVISLS